MGVKRSGMKTTLVYIGAAIAEIAGCFAFWGWLRLGKPVWWLVPGLLSLVIFAYALTLVETNAAGRAMPPMAAFTSSPRCSGCGESKVRALIGGTSPERLSA